MTACNVFAIIGITLLAFAQNATMAYSSAILRAMALPLETIMLPLIAAELFGRKAYAHIMGLLVSFNTLGYAVGGPVINLFYDLTGTYVPVMLALGVVMVLVSIAMQYCITTAHKIREAQEKSLA